jgi:hypothetical protein
VNQPLTSAHQGVSGCVEVTSPADATVPYYGYWGYPLSKPVVDPRQGPGSAQINVVAQSVQVFTPDQVQGVSPYIDGGLVAGWGFVGAAVFDCLANPTPGAHVAIEPGDAAVSTLYGVGSNVTGQTGLGLMVNVAPGMYLVKAMPGPLEGGASSIQSIRVDPNTTTAVGMFPTPPP